MTNDYGRLRPDPTALWSDAEALYRAAARARRWCLTKMSAHHGTSDQGLRDLLQNALPDSAVQRDRVAHALEVPPAWLERLTRTGSDPVAAPAQFLASLARGLRIEPSLFWTLAALDHATAQDGARMSRIFRSAAALPDAPDLANAEQAFRAAWSRECEDGPRPEDSF